MDCQVLAREYEGLYGFEQAAIWRELAKDSPSANGIEDIDGGFIIRAGGLVLLFNHAGIPGLRWIADRQRQRIWADSHYNWMLAVTESSRPDLKLESCTPQDCQLDQRTDAAGYQVTVGCSILECRLKIDYQIPADGGWIDEMITITNQSSSPLRLADWNFGASRRVNFPWSAKIPSDLMQFRAVAIPWLRTVSGLPAPFQNLDIMQVRHTKGSFGGSGPSTIGLPSEAWALAQDGAGILVVKYAPKQIEHSILRSETRDLPPSEHVAVLFSGEARSEHLIFGGSMRCRSDPSPGILLPGHEYELGLTRYQPHAGGWEESFALFRDFMEDRGCGLRPGYDPHIHWNELYDNKLSWLSADAAKLDQGKKLYYRREDMLEEAVKARAFSCETLYLDPGWDTAFASSIWDAGRFGPLPDFIRQLKDEFDLDVALHTPLAGWCDTSSYPVSALLMDRDGKVHSGHLCSGSQDYLAVKVNRLRKLAREGVSFLMFDGTVFTGPCHDPAHGHEIPYTRDAHVRNYIWLADQVHRANSRVVIEMHDFVTGGDTKPYCPVYLGYGAAGFDEIWGWELMWNPMADLASGRALALYYYNLAYSIPVYLHIDLRKDNIHCLMLWWFASTCRHLGIGGTHDNPEIVQAQKESMAVYRSLKNYYTGGKFIGLGEHIHFHKLEDRPGGVLNLFNLSEKQETITISLPGKLLGTDASPCLSIHMHSDEVKTEWIGEKLMIAANLPAMSACVVVIGR